MYILSCAAISARTSQREQDSSSEFLLSAGVVISILMLMNLHPWELLILERECKLPGSSYGNAHSESAGEAGDPTLVTCSDDADDAGPGTTELYGSKGSSQ